jgi:hypothetical protein
MRVDTTTNTTLVYNGTQWKTLKETAFVVPPIPIDYLVIGGGGSAGVYSLGSSGGGAGGVKRTSNYGGSDATLPISLSTAYTITVGNGGVSPTTDSMGNDGLSSSLSSVTSVGGGGGGGNGTTNFNGRDGASGGGGGPWDANQGLGGTGSNGFNGGTGNSAGSCGGAGCGGGGGGGFTSVGGNVNAATPNGGTGVEINIIGGTGNFYAGGGAGAKLIGTNYTLGGTGGSSIGGNSATVSGGAGEAGTFNTGSGGGGGFASTAGNGGSGVVILRYPTADLPYFTTTGTLNTPSATDTVADTAYPVTNLAYYKLDSNANDSSGNGYNGTATSITYGNGRFNEAANFNGSSSVIDISSSLINPSSPYTISMWFNANTASSYEGFYTGISSSPVVGDLTILKANATTIQIFSAATNGSNNLDALTATVPTLSNNTWYNLVVIADRSLTYKSRVFINGVEGTSYTAGSASTNLTSTIKIGFADNNYFNGSIDQVRIFSSALAPGDVEDLYNEHFPTKFTDGSDTALKFTA